MSRRGILGCTLFLLVVIGLAAWMLFASTTRQITLEPDETPLQDVFDLFRQGDGAAAWKALRETGVERSMAGSSYESLNVSERRVAWMLPNSRRVLFMEATNLVNDFRNFGNGIENDLDVVGSADDAAELERRRQTLTELGKELASEDHLLIYNMIGDWALTKASGERPADEADEQTLNRSSPSTGADGSRPPRPADLVTP